MECLRIFMLCKALRNDLARHKIGWLADTFGLEGKMKLCLIIIVELKKE